MWCLHLRILLKGKALDVYSRPPSDDIERWMELGHVDKTYEGVIYCLVRDQLLGISQKELYLFLKSKSITDSSEMTVQADFFAESRGGRHNVVVRDSLGVQQDRLNRSDNEQGRQYTPAKLKSFRNSSVYSVKCSYCHGNHRTCDCRKRPQGKSIAAMCEADVNPQQQFDEMGFSKESDSNTFLPARREDRGRGGRGQGYRGRGRSRGRGREGQNHNVSFSYDTVASSQRKNLKQNFPTQLGMVNGTEVTVLRDTGANWVIVSSDLVKNSQYTGEQRVVKFIDGTQRYCKEALVDVDTPYYGGQVLANVMEKRYIP
ncbi:hypothetical protein DPMN_167939 [Dreissena polymorpha]|uniref:Uncharacterized protein n=1 Tax=Dreissena polymorpha TaxID=45954 RepID=A0A9D4F1N2_DREPO|nr:hypothetical protein DPMN_167939 [Dreissena polymorpha]